MRYVGSAAKIIIFIRYVGMGPRWKDLAKPYVRKTYVRKAGVRIPYVEKAGVVRSGHRLYLVTLYNIMGK